MKLSLAGSTLASITTVRRTLLRPSRLSPARAGTDSFFYLGDDAIRCPSEL